MSTAYETIQAWCRLIAGVSTGTYNENLVQAAKAETGQTGDLTANEAEMVILQNETGNLTDTLPGLRTLWASVIAIDIDGALMLENGSHILLEDGSLLLLE